MNKPTRHVVFGPSARASLIDALKRLGRRDDVIALFDDLQCGPIDPFDSLERERWFGENLGFDFEQGWRPQSDTEFWLGALDESVRLIAWTTRHHAQDWLGFLLWASRLGERQGEVIDLSEFEFDHWDGRRRSLPLALIPAAKIEILGLCDRARLVTEQEKAQASIELARLGRENGAFHQTRHGEIISLPMDAFDDQLVAAAAPEFRKAAFVIGTAIVELQDQNDWHVSDLVLSSRLTALVEDGRLEAQGDIHGSIRFYEVRLAQR